MFGDWNMLLKIAKSYSIKLFKAVKRYKSRNQYLLAEEAVVKTVSGTW